MRRPATIAAVVVAGMALVLVLSHGHEQGAGREALLDAIAAPIGRIRREAWAGMPDATDALRARIVTRLTFPDVTEGALADAARGCHDRGWPVEPGHAIAAGALGDAEVFVDWFLVAWPTDPAAVTASAEAIRTTLDERTPSRAALLEHLLRGPADQLDDVESVIATDGMPDEVRFAFGRRGRGSDASPTDRASAVRRLLANGDTTDDAVLAEAPIWTLAAAGAAARTRLDVRAAGGDADAARAIALEDRDRVVRAERALLADPTRTFDRRAIAAGRLLDRDAAPGDAAILNLLDDGPADRDGSVHAAALLALRGLSDTAGERLLERWIASDDGDARRAAIVLAALRLACPGDADVGVPSEIVATIDRLAIDPDADPGLRRTARQASRAIGRWPHDDLDPAAYAARSTRLEDGRLDPDAVLLGILAGDVDASRRLGESPTLDDLPDRAEAFAAEIAWRRAILSALAPSRLAAIGEPIPGDEIDLRLWIAAVAADGLVDGPIRPCPGAFAEPDPPGDTLRP